MNIDCVHVCDSMHGYKLSMLVQFCIPEEGSHSADRNVDEDLIAENSDWNKSDSYTAETVNKHTNKTQ